MAGWYVFADFPDLIFARFLLSTATGGNLQA
jgi:hypothetical protein